MCVYFTQEHECKLTQEILELIDREVDLMMRGVKHQNLEGLRKRIATLFFHYIKTPLFNPEVARHLKVLYLFPPCIPLLEFYAWRSLVQATVHGVAKSRI